MEEEESKQHIMIDDGTAYCKAGFSGEERPIADIPSCVGYPSSGDKKEFFVGEEAESKIGVLNLNYPIEHGIVQNFDDMEKIWGHIFTNELKVEPVEHNVMLTEAGINTKESRQKMAQSMFETFNVPGFYIANQAFLLLLSSGKFTGIAIDSGEGVTQFVPIFDGYFLPHAVIKFDYENYLIAGRELTEYMRELLKETGLGFTTSGNGIVRDIKEKACYVALDFEEELKSVKPFEYELPDGNNVIIKDQRIRCTEALFKPSMVGKDDKGIGEICYDSIQKCDFDIRKDLYSSIVLSGGNTLFSGLAERMTKEVKSFAPELMKEKVKVIASPERKYSVWIGGSIISSVSSFESKWITKTDYEECGDTIIDLKC